MTTAAAIKERPILFSAPMVRAILEGRKTQTRRVMKSQPYTLRSEGFGYPTKAGGFVSIQSPHCLAECPYGVPGERLWVRETFIAGWPSENGEIQQFDEAGNELPQKVWYRADPTSLNFRWIDRDTDEMRDPPWKPSIFMPRLASRITLEITDVRVQRLQEISFEDCLAEGIISTEIWDKVKGSDIEELSKAHPKEWTVNQSIDQSWIDYTRLAYKGLWESINGKTHPWASNPWLWALTFRRIA